MALSGTLIWEVRVTGSSSNGGAFRGTASAGTPAAPTVTGSGTGGTVAANTYYVVLTYTPGGETRESPKSAETSVVLTGTTSKFTVTHPTDPGNGATYNVYCGTTSGGPYFPQGTGLAIGVDRVVTSTPPTTGTQPPGVDYSQQDSPQVTYTDLVIGASNTLVTSAAFPFTPAHVGNLINVTSGTNFTVQRVEITGVTAAGVATVDKSLGTVAATGGNGKLGGAVDQPSTINSAANVAGMMVFVKYSATPYTFAAGLTNNTAGLAIVGYDVNRNANNTDANRPIFRAGANSVAFYTTNANVRFVNLVFDNPSAFTGLTGISHSGDGHILRCQFLDCGGSFMVLANGAGLVVEDCEFVRATGQSLYFNVAGITAIRCLFRSNSIGVRLTDGSTLIHCVSYNCTAPQGAFGVQSLTKCYLLGCVAYGTTGDGFGGGNNSYAHFDRCIAYGNSGFGFNNNNLAPHYSRLINCAGGNNTSGNYNAARFTTDSVSAFIALTGDPFTNAAGFDFSLNNIAGAGAVCRQITVTFPGGATTSHPDIGAVQDLPVAAPTYYAY